MKFAVFTHVIHGQEKNSFFGYAPYINEMNIWGKFVSEIIVVAPLLLIKKTEIDSCYNHDKISFRKVNQFNIKSFKSLLQTFFYVPKIMFTIFKTMQEANHIHVRCPGNIGLLACFIQIFFPKKIKTAKYAGNWDPKATQPFSYNLQKWILSNTFLTKNMKVLVYGEWENQTQNIKPFFTASYTDSEKEIVALKKLSGAIKFLFVGTLTSGKRPLYCIQLIEKLIQNGFNVTLDIYGDGAEKEILKKYIFDKNLDTFIKLMGNQQQQVLKKAYVDSHFVILPSKSEGWPKVIAEGMFWACLPIATNVSCVANMLDNERQGLLLTLDLENDLKKIIELFKNENLYQEKVLKALNWSRFYTKDLFEIEIGKMLTNKLLAQKK